MRTIKFIIQKEFLQIFRNKAMLPIIFVMPLVQLLILTNAATFDITNVTFHLVDQDQTTTSRRLSEAFTASRYFILVAQSFDVESGEQDLRSNKAQMILDIPPRFERDLISGGNAKVQLIVNAEDGNSAGLIQSYSATIVNNYVLGLLGANAPSGEGSGIQIVSSYWYNSELNYKIYMIPGILVALVSMVGLFLTGMNVVREKEIGTIEQLNVTPIRKYQFIIGKLVPFWILGLFELVFGLTVAKLVFSMPIVGSLGLVFGTAAIYLFVVLGMGLFISTVTDTQQQAMFIAWFFMVIFMLMGGLFTPMESMPEWAQATANVNPIALFIRILRMVLLKGSQLHDTWVYILQLAAFAVVMLSLAVWRYKKVSD